MPETNFGSGVGDQRQVVTIHSVDLDKMVYSGYNPQSGRFPVYPILMPGGNFMIPAPGEQWIVVKFDFRWFLEHKLAFQDPRKAIPPKPGLSAYGSTGPTYIVGSEVDLPQSVFLGDWELRIDPDAGALQVRARGTEDWTTVSAGGSPGVSPTVIANNGKGFVNHGSNANVARPTGFASIEWMGSVAPVNATAADTWVDTT